MNRRIPSRWRLLWLIVGWTLVVASPIVGILPGPGGIFIFAAGAALLLRHAPWAKRRYVRLKRRWPRVGRAADRALRRGKPMPATID